jgi:hypothetical protein
MTDKEKIQKLNEFSLKLQIVLQGYKQLLDNCIADNKTEFVHFKDINDKLKQENEDLKSTIAAEQLKKNIASYFINNLHKDSMKGIYWTKIPESKATIKDDLHPERNGTYHIETIDSNTIKLTKIG